MKSLVGTVVLLACAVFTYQRSHVWQSRESIWAEAVKESPLLPRAHLNLSGVYEEQARFQKALDEAWNALSLTADQRRMKRHQEMSNAQAKADIALLYLLNGQFRLSEQANTFILEDHPDDRTALINRAAARMGLHDCPEAFLDYLKAGITEVPACH